MKKLKVLQLASFEGNIGDNANHRGSRSKLKENLDFELEFTNLEIREFYWKLRKFDQSFVDYANTFDVLMIGGGNYFEMWVENSSTGTSIDISPELFAKIKIPVLFYALGVDAGQGASPKAVGKFKTFLDVVLADSKNIVSVRNDGSLSTMSTVVGTQYSERSYKVPDGGFFTSTPDFDHPEIPKDKKIITINLAGDMLDTRFNSSKGHISPQEFYKGFGKICSELISKNPDIHIVFAPHIYRDLPIIYDAMSSIEDRFCRRNISVLSYFTGERAHDYIFDVYKKSALVMGNRFHTNVCAVGFGTPTIGFANYPQIEYLYEELKMPDRAVEVNKKGFEQSLSSLIDSTLLNPEKTSARYAICKESLNHQINAFHKVVNTWLHSELRK